MPVTYGYECPEHGYFERYLPMSDSGVPQTCEKCGAAARKVVVENTGGFVLKGDGWASKDSRAKQQMTERNKAAGRRMARHSKPAEKLVPNVNGEQTETWREAQAKAAEEGKDASSYEPLVQQEKGVAT